MRSLLLLAALILGSAPALPAAGPVTARGDVFYRDKAVFPVKGLDAGSPGWVVTGAAQSKARGWTVMHLALDRLPSSGFPGIPSEAGWVELDKALDAAGKAGMTVAISLTSGRPQGGMERTSKALGGRSEGLFYVEGRAREGFVWLVKTALTRKNTVNGRLYSQDPAVFGWVLGSFLDDQDDPDGTRVASWASKIAGLVKSMAPGQPVGLGWAGSGAPAFLKVAAIDFFTVPEASVEAARRETGRAVLSCAPPAGQAGAPAVMAAPKAAKGAPTLTVGAPRLLTADTAELILAGSESGKLWVEYGNEGLLDQKAEAPVAGKKAVLRLKNLKAGATYELLPRLRTNDGRQASAALLRLQTAQPRRRLARPTSPSENIITVRDGRFMDGTKPFRYTGANNYYIRYEDDPQARYEVLDTAKQLGMRVLRIQCNGELLDGAGKQPWQLAQMLTISGPTGYNEDTWKKVDRVLDDMSKRGLRAIIYVTDNWEYFGGAHVWAQWRGFKNKNDFFTASSCKSDYKALWKRWITRKNTVNGRLYKDDPTIFCWELINEARYEPDTTSKTLAAWMDEMSAYVKSLDPKHMVTTGAEGQMAADGNHYSGADFTMIHRPRAIDFCTVHLYPMNEYRRYNLKTSQKLLKQYVEIAHNELKKPVTLEEFGVNKSFAKEVDRLAYTRGMADAFLDAGGDGLTYWMLVHRAYTGGDGFEFTRDDLDFSNMFSELSDKVNP